jgi:23S rRNA pseudouridine1911/1915/1917 synthase
MSSIPEGDGPARPGSPRPPRGGETRTVDPASAGQRLDKFLADARRAGSRSRASDALARGRVFVNEAEAAPADGARTVADGDVVRLWRHRPGSAARRAAPPRPRDGLETLVEDDALIVVNKPAGMLTVPLDGVPPAASSDTASVLERLQQRFRSHGGREPLVVHRIDRDTSGCVVFALTPAARAALMAQFAERTPERIYTAIVHGHPRPDAGTWHDRLVWDDEACLQRPARPDDRDVVDALSDYRVVEAFAEASRLEIRLQTGRQGQIRAQAMLHGHALVGDRRYRPRGGVADGIPAFPRQALHAERLAFVHPDGVTRIDVRAPLPPDLDKLLDRLRRTPRSRS